MKQKMDIPVIFRDTDIFALYPSLAPNILSSFARFYYMQLEIAKADPFSRLYEKLKAEHKLLTMDLAGFLISMVTTNCIGESRHWIEHSTGRDCHRCFEFPVNQKSNRQESVDGWKDLFGEVLNSEHLPTLHHMFHYHAWYNGFGGIMWADCVRVLMDLVEAYCEGDYKRVSIMIDILVDCQHNGTNVISPKVENPQLAGEYYFHANKINAIINYKASPNGCCQEKLRIIAYDVPKFLIELKEAAEASDNARRQVYYNHSKELEMDSYSLKCCGFITTVDLSKKNVLHHMRLRKNHKPHIDEGQDCLIYSGHSRKATCANYCFTHGSHLCTHPFCENCHHEIQWVSSEARLRKLGKNGDEGFSSKLICTYRCPECLEAFKKKLIKVEVAHCHYYMNSHCVHCNKHHTKYKTPYTCVSCGEEYQPCLFHTCKPKPLEPSVLA